MCSLPEQDNSSLNWKARSVPPNGKLMYDLSNEFFRGAVNVSIAQMTITCLTSRMKFTLVLFGLFVWNNEISFRCWYILECVFLRPRWCSRFVMYEILLCVIKWHHRHVYFIVRYVYLFTTQSYALLCRMTASTANVTTVHFQTSRDFTRFSYNPTNITGNKVVCKSNVIEFCFSKKKLIELLLKR